MDLEKILIALELEQYDLAVELLAQQPGVPDDEIGVLLQCLSLLHHDKKDEAVALLKRGLTESPESVILHQIATIIYDATGFPDDAVKCTETALRLAPEDPTSLAAMASLLMENDQSAEAAQFSKKAMEADPDDVDNKLLHALALFSVEGNNLETHMLINEVLATTPDNGKALRIKECLSRYRKDKLKYLKMNLAAHPEDSDCQQRFKELTTGYYNTILPGIAITVCVMVGTFFIPPGLQLPAGILISFLGPLLLLYYIEYTEFAFSLTFSWIVFFDFANKRMFHPTPEGWSFLQIGSHLLGAVILAYLLLKMFEFIYLDIDEIDWKTFTDAKSIPEGVGAIKKAMQNLDSRSGFFYLLTFVVVPGGNLLAYFQHPILLVPCLLASVLLLGWAFSSLLKFDDIDVIVVAVFLYGLATFTVTFLVHVLLGNNVLLLFLLLLGVYVGSTANKRLI